MDYNSFIAGGLIAFLLGMVLFLVMISICLYIYLGFAFMAIGKKAKLKTPGLAWIPAIGPVIIAFQASKMHWWPWLLLIGCIIPVINWITSLVFSIFVIIWLWKTFEKIKKPGWWAILMLIPVVGLVMIGIAAWSKK